MGVELPAMAAALTFSAAPWTNSELVDSFTLSAPRAMASDAVACAKIESKAQCWDRNRAFAGCMWLSIPKLVHLDSLSEFMLLPIAVHLANLVSTWQF